jgi:beta-mannosidase
LPADYNIESEVMSSHQRSGIGNLRIKQYMDQEYKIPADFEQFLYIGQLLQAEGIKMAIESHRMAMPYCMGSLFWQINDCWPVASWSSMDYYQRWKAVQYFSREAFKSSVITTVVEDGKIRIYGISDSLKSQDGLLMLKLTDFGGKVLWQHERKSRLPVNSSKVIFECDTSTVFKSFDKSYGMLISTFISGKKIICSDIHYFSVVKDLKLPDPNLNIEINQTPEKYVLTLTPRNLCKNVFLTSPNTDVQFSDNFFDILPGQSVTVTCPKSIGLDDFKRGLKYLSVYDTTK